MEEQGLWISIYPKPPMSHCYVNTGAYVVANLRTLQSFAPKSSTPETFIKYYKILILTGLAGIIGEVVWFYKLLSVSWVQTKCQREFGVPIWPPLLCFSRCEHPPRGNFYSRSFKSSVDTANPTPQPLEEKKIAITSSDLSAVSERACSHRKVPELALSSSLAH